MEDLLVYHDSECRGLFNPAIANALMLQKDNKVLTRAEQEFLMARSLVNKNLSERGVYGPTRTSEFAFGHFASPSSLRDRILGDCLIDSDRRKRSILPY
jgi:hypothetical protein